MRASSTASGDQPGTEPGVAPVTSAERIGELDVLRGFALLGVLIANFIWFAGDDFTATQAQQQAFLAVTANWWVFVAVDWLVSDKANTLFAFLFGVGFWVQLERFRARGADFRRIYLRRLWVLLAMGLINVSLIWPWDILNLYAICGFALFLLRGLTERAMLAAGLALALVARPLYYSSADSLGLGWSYELVFSEPAIARRQAIFVDGSYAQWVGEVARLNWYDYIASGLIVAWMLYALGRFLLGAYVARRGWLSRTAELLPQIKRLCVIALPLGLAIEGAAKVAVEYGLVQGWVEVGAILHALGTPILDIGYATGLIWLLHAPRWRWLPLAFAPVGRMALTNYLAQGVFIGLVLYGFHGGLALAGTMEPREVLPAAIGFFALQMVASRWWLERYAFGPMEWVWRALTYGTRPALSRSEPGVAASGG